MKHLTDIDAKKRLDVLDNLEDYMDECQTCGLPCLLHKGTCISSSTSEEVDNGKVWSEFRKRMKTIMLSVKEKREYVQKLENIERERSEERENYETKIEYLGTGNRKNVAKIVKTAKVPSWTKSMKLETNVEQVESWAISQEEMPESVKFQDLVESLKNNRDIN